MTGLIKKVVLGTALAASTVMAVAPAEAQYYRRHRDNGDATGAAIVGGIIGLGVGAAIASSNNRGRYDDRGRYYDRGYAYNNDGYNYQSRNNYYNYNGYDYQPRNNYYNNNSYYDNGYRRSYQPRCYIERQYDQWSGQVYNVRICR